MELSLGSVPYSLIATLPSHQSLLQTTQLAINVSQEDATERVKNQFRHQTSQIVFSGADFCEARVEAKLGKHDVVLIFDPGSEHVKPDIVLRNARRLLNPGGNIILAEISKPEPSLGAALSRLGWTR